MSDASASVLENPHRVKPIKKENNAGRTCISSSAEEMQIRASAPSPLSQLTGRKMDLEVRGNIGVIGLLGSDFTQSRLHGTV